MIVSEDNLDNLKQGDITAVGSRIVNKVSHDFVATREGDGIVIYHDKSLDDCQSIEEHFNHITKTGSLASKNLISRFQIGI